MPAAGKVNAQRVDFIAQRPARRFAHHGTDSLHHCPSFALQRNIRCLALPFAAFCCTAWAPLAARR
jgi:hypothetical protein